MNFFNNRESQENRPDRDDYETVNRLSFIYRREYPIRINSSFNFDPDHVIELIGSDGIIAPHLLSRDVEYIAPIALASVNNLTENNFSYSSEESYQVRNDENVDLNESREFIDDILRENINLILSRNSTFLPSTSLIERIFNDYIVSKNKLSSEDYEKYTLKLDSKILECPICLSESDKTVKIIKCNHDFCENCINNWLLNHKNSCPICRTDIKI